MCIRDRAWKYFNNVEDGARVSKGWFKVVPAENLNESKYNDDEDFWYYADGSGNLYAGEFKTIKGKKYGFKDDGRMISGCLLYTSFRMKMEAATHVLLTSIHIFLFPKQNHGI